MILMVLELTRPAKPRIVVHGFFKSREIDVFGSVNVLVEIVFDEYRFDVLPVDVHGLHFPGKGEENVEKTERERGRRNRG